jgi:hypothetical protein
VDLRPELGERMGARGSEASAARERVDTTTTTSGSLTTGAQIWVSRA